MTAVVGGSTAAPPQQKKKTKPSTPLQPGEVTAGSVEMPLAGRADIECGVTVY